MNNALIVFLNLFTRNSCPFYPFYKPSLQGKIHNQHRQNDEEGCCQADAFVELDRVALIHLLVLRDEIRERDLQIRKGRSQKEGRDVGFVPIPDQAEEETRDVGGSRQGTAILKKM